MSGISVASEARLELEWVTLLTGDTPTADYRPAASRGVGDDLVREIADVCTSMHPHNDAAQFPRDRDVFLFFNSRVTKQFVVTRVSAVTGGNRLALRYYSVIFGYQDFSTLRFNPFQTRRIGLHDQVQQQHARGVFEPIVTGIQVEPSGTIVDTSPGRFVAGAELEPTMQNAVALEEFCARLSTKPEIPPTFATWWAGGQALPAGYFDIVLRAAQMRVLTLGVAMEMARELETTVKAVLLNVAGKVASAQETCTKIQTAAGALTSALRSAGASIDDEQTYQQHMTNASISAGSVGDNLGVLLKSDVRTVLSPADVASLTEAKTSYDMLAAGLPSVRRQANAFKQGGAGRSVSLHNAFGTGSAGDLAPAPARPVVSRNAVIAVVVIAVGLFAVMRIKGGKPGPTGEPPGPNVTKKLLEKVHGLEGPTGAEIKKAAEGEAKDKTKGAAPLSEDTLHTISIHAVETAYHDQLEKDEYRSVFPGGLTWKNYVEIFDGPGGAVSPWLANIYKAAEVASADQADKNKKVADEIAQKRRGGGGGSGKRGNGGGGNRNGGGGGGNRTGGNDTGGRTGGRTGASSGGVSGDGSF